MSCHFKPSPFRVSFHCLPQEPFTMWEVQGERKSSGSVHEKAKIKKRGLFRELTRSTPFLWKGNMGLSLIFLSLHVIYHAFLPSCPVLSLFVSCGHLISVSLFISLPLPRFCCKNQSPEFGFCSYYYKLHMKMNHQSASNVIQCSTASPETQAFSHTLLSHFLSLLHFLY